MALIKAVVSSLASLIFGAVLGSLLGSETPLVSGLCASVGALWVVHFLHKAECQPAPTEKGMKY